MTPRRPIAVLAAAAALAASAGCATRDDGASVDTPAGAAVRADEAPALVAASPEPVGAPAEAEPAPAPDPRDDAEPLAPTRDRPSWWFVRPTFVDGRLEICAAAEGDDLRGARGAAVDAGLRLVRDVLELGDGESPRSFRVDRAWVAPVAGSDGYVGYVLVSADASVR